MFLFSQLSTPNVHGLHFADKNYLYNYLTESVYYYCCSKWAFPAYLVAHFAREAASAQIPRHPVGVVVEVGVVHEGRHDHVRARHHRLHGRATGRLLLRTHTVQGVTGRGATHPTATCCRVLHLHAHHIEI